MSGAEQLVRREQEMKAHGNLFSWQHLPGKVHAQDIVPVLMPGRLTGVFASPQGSDVLVWYL